MLFSSEIAEREKRVRELKQIPDLREFCRSIGDEPELERESKRILDELRSQLKITIHFDAFQVAVDQVQDEIEKYQRGDIAYPEFLKTSAQKKIWKESSHPLFASSESEADCYNDEWEGYMWAADGRLPFKDLSFVSWKVLDRAKFIALLDELNGHFGGESFSLDLSLVHCWKPQSEGHRKEVLRQIVEIRQSFNEGRSDIWELLRSLKNAVESITSLAYDPEAYNKKHAMDRLLRELVDAEMRFYRYSEMGLKKQPPEDFRESLAEDAKKYLDAPSLHCPGLTNYILRNLLQAELKCLCPEPTAEWGCWCLGAIVLSCILRYVFDIDLVNWVIGSFGVWWLCCYLLPSIWRYRKFRNMKHVYHEISSGNYDSVEVIRRLCEQENGGLYVHSLIYPILRLNSSSGPFENNHTTES